MFEMIVWLFSAFIICGLVWLIGMIGMIWLSKSLDAIDRRITKKH